ncbi:probable carboxylesterase 9 [Vigna radiata var. radiata]|uniref:Probable carboxylesterase 9 n=1 Tax=Vigna radiata var. radiata TaxID=3916 RepID=A0A1S3VXY9_VIGRR|nr:probable carboxylesterase 9 [Vigna radiata var. radiata]
MSSSSFDPYAHLGFSKNPDGTITRLLSKTPTVEANPEPSPGTTVVSKDVTVNAEKKTWVRIFRPTKLPSNDNTVARLPIVIYFHNGGFVLFTPNGIDSHKKCSLIADDVPSIVVSASFRLAPEHRLPTQYQDAYDAVLWVKNQLNNPNGEKWLRDYGDPSRCYLYGCDCGANIAFNVSMQIADTDLKPLRIRGLVLNQPMFGGEKRTGSELKFAADQVLPLPVLDLLWSMALPKGTDRDHRYCNPMVKGPHHDNVRKVAKCLVVGFNGDIMVDRQQEFVTMLVKCGVQVEARFDQVGFHDIDMVDPARASAVVNIAKDFILG